MLDLYNNKYDMQTLKENIYAINLIDILKTQNISAEFAVKYILNKNYQLTTEEMNIKIADIIRYQPHIKIHSLLYHIDNYTKDDDSVEDFESYSNRH